MKKSFTEYLIRKGEEYPKKFDSSELAKQFVPYFENGARIEVKFGYGATHLGTKRGTVGITTGWKPVFLLMLRKDSVGSSWTLKECDEVVRVVKGGPEA